MAAVSLDPPLAMRPEQPDDVVAIHALHTAAFPTDAEARLVDRLRTGGRLAVSTVAVIDGKIVGHVAVSPVTTESQAVGAGLAPVAVLEAFRRRGIAARLIEAALAASPAAGFSWAVVLGDPAYYARFGFRPAIEAGLTDEYSGGAAFQVLELVPGGLGGVGGLVRYAPEFGIFGD